MIFEMSRETRQRLVKAHRIEAARNVARIGTAKPQRVYLAWLSVRDCWPDLTFHQFLTSAAFADTRRDA